MIQNDRVRQMVRLQAFQDRKGKEYFPIASYFKADYIGLHMLKGFFSGTLSFFLMLGMWAMANVEMLMESIHTMDLRQFVVSVILRYMAFLIIYLAAVFAYANAKYSRARRETRTYSRRLKRLIGGPGRDGGGS